MGFEVDVCVVRGRASGCKDVFKAFPCSLGYF